MNNETQLLIAALGKLLDRFDRPYYTELYDDNDRAAVQSARAILDDVRTRML